MVEEINERSFVVKRAVVVILAVAVVPGSSHVENRRSEITEKMSKADDEEEETDANGKIFSTKRT